MSINRVDMNATPRHADHPILPLHQLEPGLRRIDPGTARLSRTLCDARLRDWLAQAHGVHDWRAVTDDVVHAVQAGWLELRDAQGGATIGFDPALYPALASAAAHGRGYDDPALSATLRQAVMSILLAPVLDALCTFGADDVQVAAVHDVREADDPSVRRATMTVRFTHAGHGHECWFGEVHGDWLALVDAQLAARRVPLSPTLSEVLVPGCARLGETVLAVRTLESLRAGDLLMRAVDPALSAWFDTPARPVPLSALWGLPGERQLRARATLDGTRLTLEMDPFMTQDAHRPTPGAEETTSIDELQLPVAIEIETVTLPLVQLSALRAGYVLELPAPVREARVRLMAYGQMIGSGELVSVGDQLGVRIIQMAGADGSVQ